MFVFFYFRELLTEHLDDVFELVSSFKCQFKNCGQVLSSTSAAAAIHTEGHYDGRSCGQAACPNTSEFTFEQLNQHHHSKHQQVKCCFASCNFIGHVDVMEEHFQSHIPEQAESGSLATFCNQVLANTFTVDDDLNPYSVAASLIGSSMPTAILLHYPTGFAQLTKDLALECEANKLIGDIKALMKTKYQFDLDSMPFITDKCLLTKDDKAIVKRFLAILAVEIKFQKRKSTGLGALMIQLDALVRQEIEDAKLKQPGPVKRKPATAEYQYYSLVSMLGLAAPLCGTKNPKDFVLSEAHAESPEAAEATLNSEGYCGMFTLISISNCSFVLGQGLTRRSRSSVKHKVSESMFQEPFKDVQEAKNAVIEDQEKYPGGAPLGSKKIDRDHYIIRDHRAGCELKDVVIEDNIIDGEDFTLYKEWVGIHFRRRYGNGPLINVNRGRPESGSNYKCARFIFDNETLRVLQGGIYVIDLLHACIRMSQAN